MVGWLVVAAVVWFGSVWGRAEVKRCAGVGELVCGIVVCLDAVCEA